jgi:flagellar basal-body rod modification protein FlgD
MSISSTSGTGAAAASTTAASAIAQTGSAALTGLGSNFSTFLTMLMTQLQNQDPTSPLDSSQFTSELVQFSSVEQQINTNTNLTQLIQLTQASQVEQSSALLNKPATVTSSQLSLQSGASAVNFNTTSAEPISISVLNSSGTQVASATTTSNAGSNTWSWNGQSSSGATLPDGAYKVTVNTVSSSGTATAVPFTVTGTVTGVQNVSGVVQLQMGGLTVPFTAVQSVGT